MGQESLLNNKAKKILEHTNAKLNKETFTQFPHYLGFTFFSISTYMCRCVCRCMYARQCVCIFSSKIYAYLCLSELIYGCAHYDKFGTHPINIEFWVKATFYNKHRTASKTQKHKKQTTYSAPKSILPYLKL